jgi:hypothetical protein
MELTLLLGEPFRTPALQQHWSFGFGKGIFKLVRNTQKFLFFGAKRLAETPPF